MYLLVLFFPFLNILFTCIFGRFLGKRYLTLFIVFNMFCNFLLSLFFFYEVGINKYVCFIDIGN
jgi:hypothetical protein